MTEDIQKKLARVKLLAMDFDGVHTDGFVYVNQDGVESVRCSRRDGLGFEYVKKQGVELVVISKETNPVVRVRCEKIGATYYTGVHDARGKADILLTLLKERGIDSDQVLFIGDDINDLDAFTVAGVTATVADGHPILKARADIVLERKGGDHALRELCDKILLSRNS